MTRRESSVLGRYIQLSSFSALRAGTSIFCYFPHFKFATAFITLGAFPGTPRFQIHISSEGRKHLSWRFVIFEPTMLEYEYMFYED